MFHTSKTIEKVVLCVVAFLVTTQITIAQSYYHTPNDSIVANAVFDDVGVYNIIQSHPTNDTLYFKWKKHYINLPATWEASICDVGHCYTTIVDSSSLDAIYPSDNGLISLHLNPHFEAGTGVIQVLFWETSTSTTIDTLTWIITANGSLGFTNTNTNQIKFYPNPSNNFIRVETNLEDKFILQILNIEGKAIQTNTYNQKNIELDISHFTNGLYQFQLIHGNQVINKQFIKR
ncbi:MAG: T9SS type A sorting domain-containing protein [Chitinophagaceae bacterium]|nr:T9SS type A sorting domain-containing protein [Chitinophagaceae bacterium]